MMIANAQRVRQWCDESEEKTLFAEGLDDAVIGITRDLPSGAYRVVYDIHRVVNVLMNEQGMTHDEAVEHIEHNIAGAHVGPMTPVWSFLPIVED